VWSVRSTRFRSISILILLTLSCSRTCVGESLASADVTSRSSHPTTTSTSSRRPPLTGSTTRCAASKRLSSDRHRCATGQNYGDQESSARCKLRKHLHLFDSPCAASTHNTTKYRNTLQILTTQTNIETRCKCIQHNQILTRCKYSQHKQI